MPALIQLRSQAGQTLVSVGHQALDFPADGDQLRAGRHSVRTSVRDARLHLAHQARYPHHKKLVEVGAQDGQELHALQQRIPVVLGLFQNAPLKSQQAELPIDVEARIVQIDAWITAARSACGGGAAFLRFFSMMRGNR